MIFPSVATNHSWVIQPKKLETIIMSHMVYSTLYVNMSSKGGEFHLSSFTLVVVAIDLIAAQSNRFSYSQVYF